MGSIWNLNYAEIARDSGFKFYQCNDGVLDWKLIGKLNLNLKIRKDKKNNFFLHCFKVQWI